MPTARLRMAIQKSGRLSEDSLYVIQRCGVRVRPHRDQLFRHSENFPMDFLFVRDDDIPELVLNGQCDFGIVGTNVLEERLLSHQASNQPHAVKTIQTLTFGRCRLVLAVPNTFAYTTLDSLTGKRIATSYPHILQQFLNRENLTAEIVTLRGSIEVAPRLGLADVICDLVSTGATLEANNLHEVQTLLHSQATLIQTEKPLSQEKQSIAALFIQRLNGVLHANESKYIMLHAPKQHLNTIVELLPGAEHPTVMPLDGITDKVGVHAVCRENIFWETLEALKTAGASSILVLPIEKMLA